MLKLWNALHVFSMALERFAAALNGVAAQVETHAGLGATPNHTPLSQLPAAATEQPATVDAADGERVSASTNGHATATTGQGRRRKS